VSLTTAIRKHRLELEMTQQDLAKALGLRRVTIATYERGQVNPSLDVVRRMAAIFECSIEELLDDEPLESTPTPTPAVPHD
jgi:putative transcriptional regulator